IAHSRDQGSTWSQPVLVSDPSQSTTSLFPWMDTGKLPGSVAVAWFGANSADSEDGKGLNNDAANWKVFFAESFDATSTNPTFYEAVASDHFVHGANISLGGFGGTANRNLGDFFQVALDPQGFALLAFSDDSNDFSGNPYGCESSGTSTLVGATMKLSGLTFVPPQGTWRVHFTSNPTKPSVADRGDQWWIAANTDAQSVRTFTYGLATRNGDGSLTYT